MCQVTVGRGTGVTAYCLEGYSFENNTRGCCFCDSLVYDTGGSFDLSHQKGRGGVRAVSGSSSVQGYLDGASLIIGFMTRLTLSTHHASIV